MELVLLSHRRRQLIRRAKGQVLEVAVGTGRNLPYYPPACHVTGVDISPDMLAQAQVRAERRGEGMTRLMEGDALALPFEDGAFDTVVSTLSTCTFPDPVRALKEMRRVCRPDGHILLLEHGRSTWGWLGRRQDRGAHSHSTMIGCFWNREPVAMAEQAGLRLERVRRRLAGVIVEMVARP